MQQEQKNNTNSKFDHLGEENNPIDNFMYKLLYSSGYNSKIKKNLNKSLLLISLKMNYLTIVVVLGIVSLFLANPLLLEPQTLNEKDTYGQGYNVVELKDSKEGYRRGRRGNGRGRRR